VVDGDEVKLGESGQVDVGGDVVHNVVSENSLANVKALAQMGRGGASHAGKSHKLRDAPQTEPPHLLPSSVLLCIGLYSMQGDADEFTSSSASLFG
jgi:hypothetical protein